MTYNSLEADQSKKLGEGFLNKNVVFSLLEKNESNISSGFVLSGLFKQNGFFEKMQLKWLLDWQMYINMPKSNLKMRLINLQVKCNFQEEH